MLRLRVEGEPDEAAALADALERAGIVLERSRPRPNRGSSQLVRVYLKVEAPTAVAAGGASSLKEAGSRGQS